MTLVLLYLIMGEILILSGLMAADDFFQLRARFGDVPAVILFAGFMIVLPFWGIFVAREFSKRRLK